MKRLIDLIRETSLFPLCLDERFDDANAGNHFLDEGAERGRVILNRDGKRFQSTAEYLGDQDQ